MTVSVMLSLSSRGSIGLQCVIVLFPDHAHLLVLLLVKLYTRLTDWKTWCSCSMQKVTLLE